MNEELKSIKELILNEIKEKTKNFTIPKHIEQRGVGDIIEGKFVEIIKNINNELITETRERRGKKSIEDVTLLTENYKIYVDLKTQDKTLASDKFSMPNLTAIKKLKTEIWDNKSAEVLYVKVDYMLSDRKLMISNIELFYVWELDWSILTFGGLGLGQLQIQQNVEKLIFCEMPRNEWFELLKKNVNEIFLVKEEIKLAKQKKFWA